MIQFANTPAPELILVDSNILIYAINAGSKKSEIAQHFLTKNQAVLCIAQQNICEVLRVLTHLHTPNHISTMRAIEAISLISDQLTVISPLPVTEYITKELIIQNNISGNKIFDAYLVATALSNGVTTIATENEKDFKIFDELKIMNPFVPKNSSLA